MNERVRNKVSVAELERRWAALRKAMAAHEVDAVVVQGANNLTGGGSYLRWVSGSSAFSSQPQIAILPRAGLMTVIGHGSLGQVSDFDGRNPDFPGVGRRLSTPSFPSVGYTGRYDAELLAQEIKKHGFRRVGLIGANAAYHGPIALAQEQLAGVKFVDLTDAADRIVAIKSPEEIGFIRQAARVQDEVLNEVRSHIRVGMRDFEVMAYAQYMGQLRGSETGYYLGCSAAPGQPLAHKTTPEQGRRIEKGDLFLWQTETTGPAGFFVHLARIFSFGKPPMAFAEKYAAMVEAQEFTRNLLKPGAACSEIFATFNSYMKANGLPEEARLHCHGQGYPSVERPLIRHDETMQIAPDMNIGIHPSFGSKDMFVTVCDNYLTHADGQAERLHKAAYEIIVL